MFGFTEEEAEGLGSEGRYPVRQQKFVEEGKKAVYSTQILVDGAQLHCPHGIRNLAMPQHF